VQTLIVCLGNERISDDGVGAQVGRVLQALPLPPETTVLLLPKLRIDLLEPLAEADRLVIVDALASGAEPGMCTVADVTDIPSGIASADCAHGKMVANIMDLVRHVSTEIEAPAIDIAGIEGKQTHAFGAELSDEVRSAVPRLVDLILLSVGARVATRAMVKEVWRAMSEPDEQSQAAWQAQEVRADVTGL
jgi:hydrogenase maturation protease